MEEMKPPSIREDAETLIEFMQEGLLEMLEAGETKEAISAKIQPVLAQVQKVLTGQVYGIAALTLLQCISCMVRELEAKTGQMEEADKYVGKYGPN